MPGTLHWIVGVIASFCPARAAQERGQSQSPCAQADSLQTHSHHIARLWDVVLYFLQKHVANRHGSSSARAATCRGAMASPSGPGPAVARVGQPLIPRTEQVAAGSLLPISCYSIEKHRSSSIGVAQTCAVTRAPMSRLPVARIKSHYSETQAPGRERSPRAKSALEDLQGAACPCRQCGLLMQALEVACRDSRHIVCICIEFLFHYSMTASSS